MQIDPIANQSRFSATTLRPTVPDAPAQDFATVFAATERQVSPGPDLPPGADMTMTQPELTDEHLVSDGVGQSGPLQDAVLQNMDHPDVHAAESAGTMQGNPVRGQFGLFHGKLYLIAQDRLANDPAARRAMPSDDGRQGESADTMVRVASVIATGDPERMTQEPAVLNPANGPMAAVLPERADTLIQSAVSAGRGGQVLVAEQFRFAPVGHAGDRSERDKERPPDKVFVARLYGENVPLSPAGHHDAVAGATREDMRPNVPLVTAETGGTNSVLQLVIVDIAQTQPFAPEALVQGEDATPRPTDPPATHARPTAIMTPARIDTALLSVLLDAVSASQGAQRIELDTGSEILGKLQMSIQIHDGTLQVTLLSGRPEALDILRRSIGMLLKDLSGQGFSDVNVRLAPTNPTRSDQSTLHSAQPDARTPDFPSAPFAQSAQYDLRF